MGVIDHSQTERKHGQAHLHRDPRRQGQRSKPGPDQGWQEAGPGPARIPAGRTGQGLRGRRSAPRRYRQGARALGLGDDRLVGVRRVRFARDHQRRPHALPGRRHAVAVCAVHQRRRQRPVGHRETQTAPRQHGDLHWARDPARSGPHHRRSQVGLDLRRAGQRAQRDPAPTALPRDDPGLAPQPPA